MTREEAWQPVSLETNRLQYSVAERIVKDAYGAKYQFLSDAALQRITDTNTFYNYFDLTGQYWTMPYSLGYKPTIMPINLARWFIKKKSSWMFEVAPDIECPPELLDKPEAMETVGYSPSNKQKKANDQASQREQFLYSLWNSNRLEEKLLEAAKDFFVGGTVALKIRYLPGRGIRLGFSPAQEVFPVPDEYEPDTFQTVHFASYFDNDKTIWKQTWEMVDGKCLLTEGLYDTNLRPFEMRYNRADTQLDFIPVLIFPNEALTGDLFGISYLKDLIPLFDQYSRSMSDAADSLRFNLFAVTVLLNAAPDAEKGLKVSPGEIWNIGGDGLDVKKIESSFQYSPALSDFLTRLEHLMHMIGDVPKISPDDVKGFGQITGIGLKMLYSDLVSATQQSWRVWKSRLVQVNEMCLRMAETYKISPSWGDYTNRIIPHLPLPENEAEKIEMEAKKLATSLQSVKGALQELGEKNPEMKIAEILSEREKFMPTGKLLSQQEKDIFAGA